MANKKTILEYLRENGGAFSALALFMIFIYQIFPESRNLVKIETSLIFIWFFAYLVALVIILSLSTKIVYRVNIFPSNALFAFGILLFVISFVMIIDLSFSSLFEPIILEFLGGLPSNLLRSIFLFIGILIPIGILMIHNKKSKKIGIGLFTLLLLLFIILPFFFKIYSIEIIRNLFNKGNELALIYFSSLYASLLVLVSKIMGRRKKK